jgi:hypothetical protein
MTRIKVMEKKAGREGDFIGSAAARAIRMGV